MKRITILWAIGAITLLTACGSTRKATTETIAKTDSTAKTAEKISSVRVTTRSVDTVAKSKPDSLRGAFSIPNYVPPSLPTIAGNPFEKWVYTDGSLSVTATLDKRTGKIDLQANSAPQDVPVKVNETTVEATNHERATETKVATKTEDKQTAIVRNNKPLWLELLDLWPLLVLIAVVIIFRKKKPRN